MNTFLAILLQPHLLPHMAGVGEGDGEMRVMDLVDVICDS